MTQNKPLSEKKWKGIREDDWNYKEEDVAEAVKELKEYVSKAHSRRDILNKINQIFGSFEGK